MTQERQDLMDELQVKQGYTHNEALSLTADILNLDPCYNSDAVEATGHRLQPIRQL